MEIYKWKLPDYNKYKFNKDIAHHGDIYWYDGNELFYIGNTLDELNKPSLVIRIKQLFKKLFK